ncbi:MAG: PAS domain S-box protein [Nitrospirae bacterium]|nr:PAS domain S-box protein [Nitrospirota bacterium]
MKKYKNNCLPLRVRLQLLVFAVIAVFWLVNSYKDALALTKDERQRETREFVIASSDNFPPVNMLDKDGNLTGFGRDLSTAVIRAIGGQTNYIHSPVWTEVLDYLNSGRADFIHDTAYSKERDVFLDFSDPILEIKEVIIVRSEQYNITGFESLKGKTVACVNKHISHLYLMQFPEIKCHIVKTPVEGIYSLIAGDADAFVYPEQIVTYLFQELRLGDKIKVTGEPLRTLKWSMAVREGDKELRGLLNEGIRKVRQSGEYERIYTKWFGKKILAGYSQKEIRFFGLIAVSLALVFGISIGLFILNTRLRSGRNKLLKTIAECKIAEEMVRVSETKLKTVFDNALDGILLADIETKKFLTGNKMICEMLGYDEEELKKISVLDIHPENDLPYVLEQFKKQIRQEIKLAMDIPIKRKNGSIFYADINSSPVIIGGKAYLLGIFRDITERKQAEEALRESEEKFRLLFESAIDGIFILDMEGNFLDVNRIGYERLGYAKDELLAKNIRQFDPPEFAVRVPERLALIQKYVQAVFESAHYRKDRTIMPVEINSRIIDYGGRKVYFSIVRDITERKRSEAELKRHRDHLEELVKERTGELQEAQQALMNLIEDLEQKRKELEKANERLKELDRLKSLFVATMSHELRTPLNSIIGFSSILHDEWLGPLNDEQKMNMSAILRAGRHLFALVNDVIDVSKIEAGKIEIHLEDFDLDGVITEVVDLFKKEAGEKGLELKVESVHQRLHTDRRRLLQCIVNLMSNAVQFTEKGLIKIEVMKMRSYEDEKKKEKADFIKISVEDTGIGIMHEDISKLFQPFVRLHELSGIPGTGLGLYLTKKLVTEALKGDIIVESEYGKGTRVVMRIPVKI